MEDVILKCSKHTGRPFGLPNLSDDRRATILAKKNLHLFSHNKIAQDEGVTRQTVLNTTTDSVSPKVLELAKKKSIVIAEEIARVRDKALDRIEEHLDNGTMPASNLSTVYGVLFDKHRLQTDQSTANINTTNDHWNRFIQCIKEHPEHLAFIAQRFAEVIDKSEEELRLEGAKMLAASMETD